MDIAQETRFIYPIKLPEKVNVEQYRAALNDTHGKNQWELNKNFTLREKKQKKFVKEWEKKIILR